MSCSRHQGRGAASIREKSGRVSTGRNGADRASASLRGSSPPAAVPVVVAILSILLIRGVRCHEQQKNPSHTRDGCHCAARGTTPLSATFLPASPAAPSV